MLSTQPDRNRIALIIVSPVLALFLGLLPGVASAATMIGNPPIVPPPTNILLPSFPDWEFKIYWASNYMDLAPPDFPPDGIREPEDGIANLWYSPAFYWRDLSEARAVARDLIAAGYRGWVRLRDGSGREGPLGYWYRGLYETNHHFVDFGTVLVPFQHNEERLGVNLARVGMVVGLGNGNTPVFGLDVKDFKTYDGIAAEVTILLARPRVVWNPPAVQPPLVDIDDEGGWALRTYRSQLPLRFGG